MKKTFFLLIIILLVTFCFDILLGSVRLPFSEVWAALTGSSDNIVYKEIILNHRLPKALTAILTGTSLSVAGILMQTLFRNPLAGPDVLGVTSGASLGVALLTLTTSAVPFFILTGWGQISAAIIGAVLVLLLVILVSVKIPQTVSLLIIGMMFGNFAGAIVSILQSTSNPDTLKLFITWTFGSLSSVSWTYMSIMAPVTIAGIVIAFLLTKTIECSAIGRELCNRIGYFRLSYPSMDYIGYRIAGRYIHRLHWAYCFYRSNSSPYCTRRVSFVQPSYHNTGLHPLRKHNHAHLRLNITTARQSRNTAYQFGNSPFRSTDYHLDYNEE